MRIKKLREEKGIRIRTLDNCTNFGGLDMNGDKLFTIKTNRENTLSIISTYPTYKNERRTSYRFCNCLNHGNDIAYHASNLYIAPCAQYIGKVSTTKWEFKRIECDVYASAIAHYQRKKYLILSDANGLTYKISIAKEEGDEMEILDTWYVENPKAAEGYTISQGMAYNKNQKEIYVVFTNQDYMSNIILRSGIYANRPDTCYRSMHSTNGRYEFEGVGFTKKGRLIIGSNLPSGQDSIFISDVTMNTDMSDIVEI